MDKINKGDVFDVVASFTITVTLLVGGFVLVHDWHAIAAWWQTVGHDTLTGAGYVARAYGQAVEWVIAKITFNHVQLYGEPFHSGQNGGFVSYDGFGHCFGFEWYGTPGFFHGCG